MSQRMTQQKRALLDVFESEHLVSVEVLHERLPDIHLSTIYRNIEQFVDEGIIRSVSLADGSIKYELAHDVHDHVVCMSCSDVQSVHVDIQRLQKDLPKGFVPYRGSAVISGTCKSCL